MTVGTAEHKGRVLVIGAGGAGINAVHWLKESLDSEKYDSFVAEIVCVEREKKVGGVWNIDTNYPGLHTNSTRDTYGLPGSGFRSGVSDFPTQFEMYEYFDSYVKKFDLEQFIHFDTHVQRLSQVGGADGHFVVSFTSNPDNLPTVYDRVLLCSGLFNEPSDPNGDKIPLKAEFRENARVIHSKFMNRYISDGNTLRGKKVVVVGSGKSAIDNVMNAYRSGAKKVVMVAHRANWPVCRYFGGLVWQQYVLYSRFGEMFEPIDGPRGDISWWQWFCNKTIPGRLIRRSFWAMMEQVMIWQLWIPRELVPKHELSSTTHGLHSDEKAFYTAYRRGELDIHLDADISASRGSSTVIVTNRSTSASCEVTDVDLLIFAGGYKMSAKTFLDDDLMEKLIDKSDGTSLLLYTLFNPEIGPKLLFIGHTNNISGLLVPAITLSFALEMWRCHHGDKVNPAMTNFLNMKKLGDCYDDIKAKNRYAVSQGYPSGLFHSWGGGQFADLILKRLDVDPYLGGWNPIWNFLQPICATRYKDVNRMLMSSTAPKYASKFPYFRVSLTIIVVTAAVIFNVNQRK